MGKAEHQQAEIAEGAFPRVSINATNDNKAGKIILSSQLRRLRTLAATKVKQEK